MKSLLEQIYFSEVIPNTSAVPDSPEYNRLTERVFEREEHFHEILAVSYTHLTLERRNYRMPKGVRWNRLFRPDS